ncbi:hypothetical protein CNMCM8927_007301 [Aspergillus lentulus]|uniref:Uncharacterized protein n=1 Tax=Aspergillus lentulus TaxID=293939 RepID=A0AAN5YNV4_ASPLE|nr:hypothetical protein CNMCM8927_007301 [Aspergillus lentulus]
MYSLFWAASWTLGLNNELVVIGLLLSVMNECTGMLAPTFFLILETRRTSPTLQNYAAIIKKSVFLDKEDVRWRACFLLLTLPVGLNVFPEVYGFNTVILDNTSTALLDLPSPDFLSSFQQNLTAGESWSMSAAVDGTVVRYNSSTLSYKDNDAFWTAAFNHSYNPTGLSTISLYNGYQMEMINGLDSLHSENPGPYCLIGFFKGDAYGQHIYSNATESTSLAFRKNAYKFDIQREKCEAQWTVTRSSIQLTSGHCTGERTKQVVFNSTTPYYADTLPLLATWLIRYSPAQSQSQSPWLLPSLTSSVASMFWARIIYMDPTNNVYPEIDHTERTMPAIDIDPPA